MRVSVGEDDYILTYDQNQQAVTDSRALPALADGYSAFDLNAVGSALLVADGRWDVPLQRLELRISLLNDDLTRTVLPLQHDFCLYVFSDAAQESITTIELDGGTYFLCQYDIHASGE